MHSYVVYVGYVCLGAIILPYSPAYNGKRDLFLYLTKLSMKESVLPWGSILQLTLHDGSKKIAIINLSLHKWSVNRCKIQKDSQRRGSFIARSLSTAREKVFFEGYILFASISISTTLGIVHQFLSYKGHLSPWILLVL